MGYLWDNMGVVGTQMRGNSFPEWKEQLAVTLVQSM